MTYLPNPNFAQPKQTHPKKQWEQIRKQEAQARQQIGTPQLRGQYQCIFCSQTTTNAIKGIYVCQQCILKNPTKYTANTINKLQKP